MLNVFITGQYILILNDEQFNPIQDGEGKKATPYQFFPVTSTNVGITPPRTV